MLRFSRRGAMLLAGAAVAGRGARAEGKDTVTVAIQYGVGYLPVIVADKLALFAAHAKQAGAAGTLAVRRMSGAPAINDALISGSIDIGAYGIPGMLIAHEKTQRSYDVRGLAALSSLPYVIFSNDPAVRTVADIRPTDRIAVTATNTPQAELLRMAARKQFGDPRKLDTQMVSLPHPDATTALISGGSITLYVSTPPFTETLDASPRVHRVATSNDILGEDVTGAMLAATSRFAKAEPLLTRAFVDSLVEADGIIANDPQRAAAIYLQSETSKLGPDQVVAILKQFAGKFGIAPSGTMAFARSMATDGQLKAVPASWQDVYLPPVSEGQGS